VGVDCHHPSGQQEDVIGFHTEKEAKEWRKSNGCRAWLRTRGYPIKPDSEQDPMVPGQVGSMPIFSITHVTDHRYQGLVAFGELQIIWL
jgi:hypothetical protein